MNKKFKKAPEFKKYLAKQLKNRRFRENYETYGKKLEVAYSILQLRKQAGLSQAQLAEKIGTKQNNVARIETGQQNLTTDTLQKIAAAFQRDLKIDFVETR